MSDKSMDNNYLNDMELAERLKETNKIVKSKCEGCQFQTSDNPACIKTNNRCMACFQSAEKELAELKASWEEKKEEIRKEIKKPFSLFPSELAEYCSMIKGLQKALEIIENE